MYIVDIEVSTEYRGVECVAEEEVRLDGASRWE